MQERERFKQLEENPYPPDFSQYQLSCGSWVGVPASTGGCTLVGREVVVDHDNFNIKRNYGGAIGLFTYSRPHASLPQYYTIQVLKGMIERKSGFSRAKFEKGIARRPDHLAPYPEQIPFLPPMTQPAPRPDPIPWVELPSRPDQPGLSPEPGAGGGKDDTVKPTVPVDPISPGPDPTKPPPKEDPNFPGNPPHKPSPPRKREKEKKLRVPRWLMAALKVAHEVTEYKDMIDAIWDGVPNQIKAKYEPRGVTRKGAYIGEGRKYYTPEQKAFIIYRHVNDIDWTDALLALAKNQIEDSILGRINAGADGFANKHLGGNRALPF